MITILFLSSGLFLGWSLGANDAANIFGTAVGSRMVRFGKAALIASLFVVLGAVVQGAGASNTLTALGGVSTLAAAFTVALAAGVTIYWMTRSKIPVSTSQAIVGAIIGWNLYTGNPTDGATLVKILLTWVSSPVFGGVIAVILFALVRKINNRLKFHLLYRDSIIRYSLIIAGAFGAYSLGANNIANVMGVFTSAVEFPSIKLGIVTIDTHEQLFFLGGLAIAAGIVTYSRKVMETVGSSIMPISPNAAIVVVFAQALVMFVFSSQALSDLFVAAGLFAIPLVPVSSSQIVIGALLGIGLYKGGKEVKFKILGKIGMGWVVTPLVAGITAYLLLFFVDYAFRQDVGIAL